MTPKYYAYNWLINIEAVDFNALLNFVDENGLALRRDQIGNKFLRFLLAVDNDLQLQQFSALLDKDISITDWHSISYSEFESAVPIEHDQAHRSEELYVFDLMHEYTRDTSKFYRQAYEPDTGNRLYRMVWKLNKKGFDDSVIEKTFEIVERLPDVYLVWVNRITDLAFYVDLYMVIPAYRELSELIQTFPDQIVQGIWVEISPDEIPDFIGRHPYKSVPTMYAIWREEQYEWLLRYSDT